jgi:hypothetical protein
MARIAVIGNSHIGAWKAGWDTICIKHPSHSITFFGSRGLTLETLEPRGDRLVTGDAKVLRFFAITAGKQEILARDHDVFVIVALGISPTALVSDIYNFYRADSHRGREGNFTPVSDAEFVAAAVDLFVRSVAVKTARKLRRIGVRCIFFAPQPFRSADAPATVDHSRPRLISSGDDTRLAATFAETCRVIERYGTILPQPAATRDGSFYTKAEFREAAKSIVPGRQPKASNTSHMNSVYGEWCLSELLARI